jgi:hypothetical protein
MASQAYTIPCAAATCAAVTCGSTTGAGFGADGVPSLWPTLRRQSSQASKLQGRQLKRASPAVAPPKPRLHPPAMSRRSHAQSTPALAANLVKVCGCSGLCCVSTTGAGGRPPPELSAANRAGRSAKAALRATPGTGPCEPAAYDGTAAAPPALSVVREQAVKELTRLLSP